MGKKKSLPSLADPLQRYIAEASQYPLLSKNEEHDLAIRYFKQGDIEAAHKLVTANLRFVIKIAYEYAKYGLRLIDLVQEGNIGLMRAVKSFNPYKDTRLITYAVWWIRSYIHDYIQKNWSLVKIGTTQAQRKLFYQLQKERDELAKYNIQETPKLLADKLNVKEEEVVEMQKRMKSRDLSLDAPIGDEDKSTHIDFVADESGQVEEILSEKEEEHLMMIRMKKFEHSLKGRDLFIYQKRLISDAPMSLQELGDHFGVSKERARQLEERIKKGLKQSLLGKH